MSGQADSEHHEGGDEAGTRVPSATEVERVAREFTSVFHDLKQQTFSTTTWLGVPLVKTPSDMIVMQQIIVETRPELIVETGVYVGGSAMLFASIMDLLGIDGRVLAVDVDLSGVQDKVREHPRIDLLEGSSVDPEIVSKIRAAAEGKRTMVDLDSDHRAHHVLEELRTYSPLVTPGCYLIVEDGFLGGRPVRPDAVPGPSEALDAWLAEDPPFEPDRWHERYLMTQSPRGYLRRVGDDAPPPRPPRPSHFMIGALELSGVNGGSVTPDPESAIEEFTAQAGEADMEVDALRRSISNMAREQHRREIDSDLDRRRTEHTVEGLMKELDVQRELLQERSHLLARERAHLKRIQGSLPYRFYKGLRRLPGFAQYFRWRDRSRRQAAQTRSRKRSEGRAATAERFSEHHRGQ